MMNDANIRDNTLTQKRLDLLFCKVNKHRCNMNFETFCNLLPLIANEKYPNIPSEESSIIMIQEHLMPLFENIYNETEVGFDDMLFRKPIEESTIYCLKYVHKMLLKVYQVYFKWETQKSL